MEVGYGGGQGVVESFRRTRYETYVQLNRWADEHRRLVMFGAALSLAVAMAALAQIRLFTPLTPVPFTMQTFGAVLMGGLLGRRWGSASAGMYLLMGLVGLPVFAGQMAAFESFTFLGGLVLFTTVLSAWYIVGFIAMAWVVGAIVDTRHRHRSMPLVVLAPLGVGVLTVFALLQVYVLTNYQSFYPTLEGFPNVWFLLAAAGTLLIVGGAAWLALTTKARRERIELFFGCILGLLVLYVVGAIGFWFIWEANPALPALTLHSWLAYTVLPFIPVDVAKILLAVGLITLVRPTRRELEAAADVARPSDR